MKTLVESLTGQFVIVNLGAAGDSDYPLPPIFQKAVTLIELDAGHEKMSTSGCYLRKYSIKGAVAGRRGKRQLRRSAYWGASSLYEHCPKVIEMYGLHQYTKILETSEVEPIVLQDILDEHRIESIDFLKTDLEGADFEVIKSIEQLLNRLLAIQCELRFKPCYIGEPYFHDAAGYLYDQGFELMSLRPEYWKPDTPNRQGHQDGQIIWADCFFFKKPELLFTKNSETASLALAKQIILAGMLGHRSHAEWLLNAYRDDLPSDWGVELRPWTLPAHSQKLSSWRTPIKTAIRAALSRIRVRSLLKLSKQKKIPRQSESPDFDFAHVVRRS